MIGPCRPTSTRVSSTKRVHVGDALSGSVETVMPPPPSPMTHRLVAGQEIVLKANPLTSVRFHAAVPPVGFVEVNTLPAASMAAQKLVDGQETPASSWSALTLKRCQAAAPPPGFVEVRM